MAISRKRELIAAAERILDHADTVARGVSEVPTDDLDFLREVIKRARPVPMPEGLSMTDPDYYRELAKRGSGNRTTGTVKRQAGAAGGYAGKGSKKPTSGRWPKGSKR